MTASVPWTSPELITNKVRDSRLCLGYVVTGSPADWTGMVATTFARPTILGRGISAADRIRDVVILKDILRPGVTWGRRVMTSGAPATRTLLGVGTS